MNIKLIFFIIFLSFVKGMENLMNNIYKNIDEAIIAFISRIVSKHPELSKDDLYNDWKKLDTVVIKTNNDIKSSVSREKPEKPELEKAEKLEKPELEKPEKPLSKISGCPYKFSKGDKIGLMCGKRAKDGTYCSIHKKHKGQEQKEKKILPTISNPKKPVLNLNKKLGKFWHAESKLVFNESKVVYGIYENDKIEKLSDNDIETCKKYGFKFIEQDDDDIEQEKKTKVIQEKPKQKPVVDNDDDDDDDDDDIEQEKKTKVIQEKPKQKPVVDNDDDDDIEQEKKTKVIQEKPKQKPVVDNDDDDDIEQEKKTKVIQEKPKQKPVVDNEKKTKVIQEKPKQKDFFDDDSDLEDLEEKVRNLQLPSTYKKDSDDEDFENKVKDLKKKNTKTIFKNSKYNQKEDSDDDIEEEKSIKPQPPKKLPDDILEKTVQELSNSKKVVKKALGYDEEEILSDEE